LKLANKLKAEADEKAKEEFDKEQEEKLKQEEKESKKLFNFKKEEDAPKQKAEFVPDKTDANKAIYLRRAIKELNPKITDEKIDSFKEDYRDFAWAVAFAPANDPEIAVVTVIPQGNSSSLAILPIREILGQYFGLLEADKNKNVENSNKEAEVVNKRDESEMNFVSQLKK
ncbi:MAG: penicillin-binding transpeptidase domain-containing protein, partial [Paraclostridium sp.]